jgi:hypothetical protein
MALHYAAQQASGFVNRIRNIAIVGASGNSGSHIVSSLLARKQFNITAISRADSKGTFAEDINVVHVDYDNPDTIVAALKGHDALIVTMRATAARDTQQKLIRAAADAGVSWVMPNEFGMYNTEEAQYDTIGPGKTQDRKLIESLGLSWVGLTTGFWYEHSLSGPGFYGFNIGKREVVFFDDGMQRLNTSTWAQVGRGVASLFSLPILPSEENDTSVTLSSYRNRMAFVSSFAVSQREMFESLQRVTGTKESDWTVSSVPAKQRYAEAKVQMKADDRMAFGRALYTRYFYEDAGLYEKSHGLDNEKLALPEEDLDEATRGAIQLMEGPYWRQYGL